MKKKARGQVDPSAFLACAVFTQLTERSPRNPLNYMHETVTCNAMTTVQTQNRVSNELIK